MEDGRIKVWLPAVRTGTGTDVFTRRLAEALEREGLDAQVTWFPWYFEVLPFLLMFAQPPAGTDVVLANSWNGCAFKRSGLPLVVTAHLPLFAPELRPHKGLAQRLYHRLVVRLMERLSFRNANVVTAVSAYVADNIRREYGIKDVKVIYNWVDAVKFCPAQLRDQGSRPFRLLCIGKLSIRKGADLLGPIMQALGPGFELWITASKGDGKPWNLPDHTVWLGRLPESELIPVIQSCDALLFPTRAEGFGYVAAEAMACGKPVIASRSSSIPEIVVDGETGLLCAVDDVADFVSACRKLQRDERMVEDMGTAARARILSIFSESSNAGHYARLIRSLVKGVSR